MTSATYTPVSQQTPGRPPREHADFAWDAANAEEAKRITTLYPQARQDSAVMPLLWLAEGLMGERVQIVLGFH